MRNRISKTFVYSFLSFVGIVASVGCGSGGYAGPTGNVSGTVKLGGQSVPDGCNVAFVSDSGFTATGLVSGGSYTLHGTSKNADDIPVGEYRVMVTPPATTGQMSDAEYDKMMSESASGQATPSAPEKTPIPAKYNTTTTSGLKYEVKEGSNTIDIEMQ